MTEARQRLIFAKNLMDAIKADHNERHAKGTENKRFSASKYQSEILRLYPRVETSILFPTIKRYFEDVEADDTLNRDINEDKIEGILGYVFHHNGHKAWPKTEALVRETDNDNYLHYIKQGRQTDTYDQKMNLASQMVMTGVAQMKEIMKDKNKEIKDLKDEMKGLYGNVSELEKNLKRLLEELESKNNATPAEKRKIKELKKLL